MTGRLMHAPQFVAMTLFCAASATMSGCGSMTDPDGDGNGQPAQVSFSDDVQPILTTNCAGCHSAGGMADLSGIALRLTVQEAYDDLVDQLSVQDPSLTLVMPGDVQASLLVDKVSNDAPAVGDKMPLFAPMLTADEIELISLWIEQGALEN